MIRFENSKKRRRRKQRRFILILLILIILTSALVYISIKISAKKNIVNTKTNNINQNTLRELPTNRNVTLREHAVNTIQSLADISTANIYKPDGYKTAYLTFDDGPSPKITPEILNVLDKFNVKATFFVIGGMAEKNPDIIKAEFKDGQSIGNHTYSHNYQYLYSDTNNLINDINKCDTVLKSILGSEYNTKLVRFPGGSFGSKMEPFRKAVNAAGYNYIDWNDLTGDADGQNVPTDKLLSNLKKYSSKKNHVVILMHDAPTKETTVQALPQVIEYLKSQGYAFAKLK